MAVGILAAAFVLGMLPPAFSEDGIPETVMREVDVPAAELADPDDDVERVGKTLRSEDGGWTDDHTVCTDITFTSAAVAWSQKGGGDVPVVLRWGDRDQLGPAFRTYAQPDEVPEEGTEGDGKVSSPVVWTNEARCLEVRMELDEAMAISDVEVTLLNTSGTATRHTLLGSLAAGFREAMGRMWGMAEAEAIARRPGVISRKRWGADESKRNCGPNYAPRLKMAYVHHTVNGNGYSRSQAFALMRSIYAYHTDGRGWCDIAYNFLVDRFGRIFVGRAGGVARPVIGGHAQGFNTGSTGVAVIGDFSSRRPPTAVIRALRRLLAWRLDVAHLRPRGRTTMVSGGGSATKYKKGERVRLPVIAGHRHTGYTACPGNGLWNRLKGIRRGAQRLGRPKIFNPRSNRATLRIGNGETVTYRAGLTGTPRWTVRVEDETGERVWRRRRTGSSILATWDGTDQRTGAPALEGTYTVSFHARGRKGNVARVARITTNVTWPP